MVSYFDGAGGWRLAFAWLGGLVMHGRLGLHSYSVGGTGEVGLLVSFVVLIDSSQHTLF